MKFDLASTKDSGEAMMFLTEQIREKKKIDIKVIKPRRSLNQNAYLHLILGEFAMFVGCTLEEAKLLYKQLPGNKSIYVYKKEVKGKEFEFVRSSADLNVEEMNKSIDTLHEWAVKMGHPLPPATDMEALMRIENDMEKQSRYL